MTKLFKTTIFLFSLVLVLSCSNDDEPNINDTYLLEFGSECGWCAGTEYITLQKGTINYERKIPCGENQGTENKSIIINDQKWEEIVEYFDYNYFTTLDYNICNVCADGCDEIIRITKDGIVHEIRYNPSQDIKGLEILQEKLREYLAEFYEPN